MVQDSVKDVQYCERVPFRMVSITAVRVPSERVTSFAVKLLEEGPRYLPRGEIRGSIVWLSRFDSLVMVQNDFEEHSAFYTDAGASIVATRELEDTLGERDGKVIVSVSESEYTPDSESYTPLVDLLESSEVVESVRT